MQIDVEEIGLAVGAVDDVALPHLLRQRLRLRREAPPPVLSVVVDMLQAPFGRPVACGCSI